MGRSNWAVWAPTVSGPLAEYAPGYQQWLIDRGFTAQAKGVAARVWQLGHLSRWLEAEGLAPGKLTSEQVARFVAPRRAAGRQKWASPLSLRLPLAFLREVGVVPDPAPSAPEGPLERLVEDYRRYLARERGVTQKTIKRYERVARLFLGERAQGSSLDLEWLTAADVTEFLTRECPKRGVPGARELAMSLRPLLRYLHVAGLIETPLRWAVPRVADLRDRSLPRGLDPVAVRRLLASCDRRRTVGRRDYAVLLLMARLGLRAGEVAALTLDDVDWRRGEIVVRGKGPFAADLEREGTGRATIVSTLAVLQGVLKRAVRDYNLASNAVQLVDKPSQRREREPILVTVEQVESMRAWCLAREDLRSATLLSLLAYAGPRPESEALPLRWEAIRKRTILFRATKRGVTSERATRLLAPLAGDLTKWRKASGNPPVGDLVVPNRAGEPWADYDWDNWRERTFRPAAAAAGLPAGEDDGAKRARPRDLRSSFATLLIYEGQPPQYVAAQLGNSVVTLLSVSGGGGGRGRSQNLRAGGVWDGLSGGGSKWHRPYEPVRRRRQDLGGSLE